MKAPLPQRRADWMEEVGHVVCHPITPIIYVGGSAAT